MTTMLTVFYMYFITSNVASNKVETKRATIFLCAFTFYVDLHALHVWMVFGVFPSHSKMIMNMNQILIHLFPM